MSSISFWDVLDDQLCKNGHTNIHLYCYVKGIDLIFKII